MHEVSSNLSEMTQEYWKKFEKIWAEFGYSNETMQRRESLVLKHVQDLFIEMFTEEESRFDAKTLELKDKQTEYERLCRQLKKKIELINQRPLLTYEQKIDRFINDLEKERKLKTEKFDAVREKEKEIASELGEELVDLMLAEEDLPGDIEIKKVEESVKSLKLLRLSRVSEYLKYKDIIVRLLDEIGRTKVNELERYIQCRDQPEELTKDYLMSVEELKSTVETEAEEASSNAEYLREQMKALSSRLKKDIVKTELLKGYDVQTVEKLTKEVLELEEEKKRNLPTFIDQIRKELNIMWKECFAKPSFPAFEETQTFDEDLLELHEKELSFWEKYYCDNRETIELVNKRNELWERYSFLEVKADDPNRLMNRGGALLKEEKERKELKVQIGKIVKLLEKMIKEYEKENEKKFLFFGQNIFDVFQSSENALLEQIEEARMARKTNKDDNNLGNITRRKRAAATPVKGILTPAKRGKANTTRVFAAPTLIQRTPAKTDAHADPIISPTSTYSEFQNHLMCQSVLNSSRAPPNSISNQNHNKSPMKRTIKMTPARANLDFNQF